MTRILRMTGRCSSGAERDGGARYHSVPDGGHWEKAVCVLCPARAVMVGLTIRAKR